MIIYLLLMDIRKELIENALKKYKYPDGSPIEYDHLRVYFHYRRRTLISHIHVTLADSQTSCAAGQAVLLDRSYRQSRECIANYYNSIRTLSMEFGEQHELYHKLR